MSKKILIISSVVIVMIMGVLYLNYSNLIAGDRDGKSCTSTTAGCESKTSDVKADNSINAGGEIATYEFATDKACCDEMKSTMQADLMSVAGVKEVNFGSSCGVSKVTMVSVKYAAGETSEETLATFLKDKNLDCSNVEGCTTEGKCTGKKTKNGKEI